MTSAGKAAVRTFLNIVGSIRDDFVPERDGGHAHEVRHSLDSSASGGTGRALLLESLQNRLGDGLFEAPRAENYEHVMKGAQRNRVMLQARPLPSAGKKSAQNQPFRGTHGEHGDDDDDNRSEDSRMDEEMVIEQQIKSVKPFSFRSLFSKTGHRVKSSHAGHDSLASPSGSLHHTDESKVNRYILPEATVSGDNPFISPFIGRAVETLNVKGVMGMMEAHAVETDRRYDFRIRHHDFDPNLFIFGEDAKESPRISSANSVLGRGKSPSLISGT
jgi:hypothetical protein